jgi:hypothetical protein
VREARCAFAIRSERFLGKDRNASAERSFDHRGVRDRRRCDNDTVDGRQRIQVLDHAACAAFERISTARWRTRDDRHVTPEKAQITQDVATPPSTTDQAHPNVHRPLKRLASSIIVPFLRQRRRFDLSVNRSRMRDSVEDRKTLSSSR